jgi:hypothetical protein
MVGSTRLIAAFAALLLTAACGGGHGSQTAAQGPGRITGVVTKGPVSGATVTAYQITASLQRTGVLVSTTTNPDGSFTLTVPPYNGALEIVATGGSYLDEVRRNGSNQPLTVSVSREMSSILASYSAAGSYRVTISPVSTIARGLTKAYLANRDLGTAVTDAWTCVNQHFGGVHWQDVAPLNLSVNPGESVVANVSDDATKAGLILAGFSQLGKNLAPTTTLVTGITLAGSVAQDAEDGVLDGKLNGAALPSGLGGSPNLTSYSLRTDLAQALLDYTAPGSPANVTGLTQSDVYPLASAIALDASTCAFPASQPPNADTSAPAPHLAVAPAPAYYDERSMGLLDASVPARYGFPLSATKVALTGTSAVYKASTRLSPPATAPATLPTTNPDNIPFLQITIPRGPAAAPLTDVAFMISDGTTTNSGDLMAWSVGNNVFDLPLVAYVGTTAIAPMLANAKTNPTTLTVTVSAADASGAASDPEVLATIRYTVLAPPLYVAEDTSYPVTGASGSSFAYTIAGQNFNQLFNQFNTAFIAGEVRLVRYVISNPHTVPVGARATFGSIGTGWTSTETWTRFAQAMPNPYNVDGFSFGVEYCDLIAGFNACSTIPQMHDPCGTGANFWHIPGSTATPWSCSGMPDHTAYDTNPTPFTFDAATASTVYASLWAAAGGTAEAARPGAAGQYAIVPAQSGSAGQVTFYVVRPVIQDRAYPGLSWNKFTTNNRFEVLESMPYWVVYNLDTFGQPFGSRMQVLGGILGGAFLSAATENLSGRAAVYTTNLNGAVPILDEAVTFATTVSRALATH